MVITPAFQVGDVGSIPVTRTTQWASMFQGFGDLSLQGRCGGFDSHLVHKKISESSSVGRARPCQGRGRGFETRLSLNYFSFLKFNI